MPGEQSILLFALINFLVRIGGLVVMALDYGTKRLGPKPDRSRRIVHVGGNARGPCAVRHLVQAKESQVVKICGALHYGLFFFLLSTLSLPFLTPSFPTFPTI